MIIQILCNRNSFYPDTPVNNNNVLSASMCHSVNWKQFWEVSELVLVDSSMYKLCQLFPYVTKKSMLSNSKVLSDLVFLIFFFFFISIHCEQIHKILVKENTLSMQIGCSDFFKIKLVSTLAYWLKISNLQQQNYVTYFSLYSFSSR